jgi:hypothetical protein
MGYIIFIVVFSLVGALVVSLHEKAQGRSFWKTFFLSFLGFAAIVTMFAKFLR